MTIKDRLNLLSTKTGFLRFGMTVTLAGAIALSLQSSPALAASSVSSTGTPGLVYESNPPATCVDYVLPTYPNTSGVQSTVYAPTVMAAMLRSGSQWQYVHYRALLFDTTSKTYVLATTYSPWAVATVKTAAQWAAGWASPVFSLSYDPYTFPNFVAVIVVEWWDPVSRQTSATLQYTVDKYWRFSPPSTYYSTPSCN
jgi:hypothetical protein